MSKCCSSACFNPPRRTGAMETRDRVVTAINQALTAGGIALYNPNA